MYSKVYLLVYITNVCLQNFQNSFYLLFFSFSMFGSKIIFSLLLVFIFSKINVFCTPEYVVRNFTPNPTHLGYMSDTGVRNFSVTLLSINGPLGIGIFKIESQNGSQYNPLKGIDLFSCLTMKVAVPPFKCGK